ncbi:MAG: hypothetical protein ACREQ9_05705 [Candidatus Binatia bacterium]
MSLSGALLLLAGALLFGSVACQPQVDPRVRAAQQFESTVYDLVGRDEAQTKKLNSLRLGMSDSEVLAAVGSPSRRESRTTDEGTARETWVYAGELTTVGTLTFENGRLVQMQTN